MCFYVSLSALHISNSLVHHQEQRFGAVYRNWYKTVCLAVVRLTAQQPNAPSLGTTKDQAL